MPGRVRSAALAAVIAGGAIVGCDPGAGVLNPRPEDPGVTGAPGKGGTGGFAFGTGGGEPVLVGSGGVPAGIDAPADAGAIPPPGIVVPADGGRPDGGSASDAGGADATTSPASTTRH